MERSAELCIPNRKPHVVSLRARCFMLKRETSKAEGFQAAFRQLSGSFWQKGMHINIATSLVIILLFLKRLFIVTK
jgi:hypothetical protein